MKRLLQFLVLVSSVVYGEDVISKPVCMSWYQVLLLQWQTMSVMYKTLLIVLIGLAAVALYKLLSRGKNCSCGCLCSINGACDE